MPILNYTTTVPTDRTMGQVQGLLVRAGAWQVLTNYEAGKPTSIAFTLNTPSGPRSFVLPVDTEAVHFLLDHDRKVERRFKTKEQAERVAWRIIKDWLEAQLAILESGMVSFDQIMLPYMRSGNGQTMYELYLADQLALGTGT